MFHIAGMKSQLVQFLFPPCLNPFNKIHTTPVYTQSKNALQTELWT